MTADARKVREIAAATGCSLSEAKRIATKLDLIDRAERATDIEALRTVVKELIIEVLR